MRNGECTRAVLPRENEFSAHIKPEIQKLAKTLAPLKGTVR
jgi:hypothetical protein